MFSVTAAGSLGDGVLYNDSSDDDTWDAVWDAAVSIDDKGWCAEMRIPFSQLRFSEADKQVWGLHVVRMIQRKNEESWWSFVPKKESGSCRARASWTGLDGIESRRHLELLPYVTARASQRDGRARRPVQRRPHRHCRGVGLDLKWGVTSNMTLDATVNPDFGQVEVDPAVVNLTAFETFYDEKRPFFIEGSQAFDRFGRNGASGYMGFNRTNPTLFYSRRIGRTPQGAAAGEYVDRPSATTILGAAKLTGKTSRGWTVNFIDAVTAREFADTSTGGVAGRDRGGAAHQLPGRARAPGRRTARRIRHAGHRREPRTWTIRPSTRSSPAARSSSAATATSSSPASATTSSPAACRAAAWPDRRRRSRDCSGPRRATTSGPTRRTSRSIRSHVAVRVEPADRLQQEQRRDPAECVVLGGQPRVRGERPRLRDERRPPGRPPGAGVAEADAGQVQPQPQLLRREVEHLELRRRSARRRLLRELLRPPAQLLVVRRVAPRRALDLQRPPDARRADHARARVHGGVGRNRRRRSQAGRVVDWRATTRRGRTDRGRAG